MNIPVLLQYTALWIVFVLTTDFWNYIDGSCNVNVRYERDVAFDGVVPTPAWYYINSIPNLSFASCTLACFQSVSVCSGYLFSSQHSSCKLLRTFLTQIDRNGSYIAGDWEYRSRAAEILSLNKPVTASSNYEDYYPNAGHKLIYLVDGITNAPGKFHTYYEPYPWVTIDLENFSIIRDVVMYNRADDHGRWLHSVEIRVGNSSVWSEMTTCGTYPGHSETGDIIVVECRPSCYGRYVTLKIVQLNYITDDSNANNGNNALGFEELVVIGLYF
uniref:F5/8 type C domain-containing protein n=1 Tax=Magallana gigas TaxID=29159 RepID=A0A8W8M3B6_MAGGI